MKFQQLHIYLAAVVYLHIFSSLEAFSFPKGLGNSPRSFSDAKHELSRKLSHYQQNYYTSSPPVRQLNEYLAPFSDCFLHIINYEAVDFYPAPTLPLLLSRYDLTEIQVVTPGYRPMDILFSFPFEKLKNTPTRSLLNVTFSAARYMNTVTDGDEIEKLYENRTTQIKPWQCEAHIYLFPPAYENDSNFFLDSVGVPDALKGFWKFSNLRRIFRRPVVSYHQYGRDNKMIARLDTMPQCHILVNEKSGRYDGDIQKQMTDEWLWMVTPWKWTGYITSQNFMVWELENANITMLFGCQTCKRCEPFQLQLLKMEQNFTTREQLDDAISKQEKWSIMVWRIGLISDDMFLNLGSHGVFTQRTNWNNVFDARKDIQKMQWEIGSLLLGSLIPNATYTIRDPYRRRPRYSVCYLRDHPSNQLLANVRYQIAGQMDPLHFSLEMSKLRFVSCGNPQKNLLAFHELFSVFEYPVWIAMALGLFSLLICSISVNKIPKFNNQIPVVEYHLSWKDRVSTELEGMAAWIMMLFKPLVEQGGPIPENFSPTRKFPIYLMIIPFLFMATVISCAYKNENISRLTSPISAIPFDEFKLLRENHFQVFTKATVIRNFLGQPDDLMSYEVRVLDSHHATGRRRRFESELMKYIYANYYWSQNYSKEVTTYVNHSRLHSKLWYDAFLGQVDYMDFIKDCNYTAIIQEDQDAREMHFKWKKSGRKHAFLSKEILLATKRGWELDGYVDPGILKRIQRLYASGVPDHWDRFLNRFLALVRINARYVVNSTDENRAKTGTNMQGNIAVVFILLPPGLFLGICVFVWEKRERLREIGGKVKVRMRYYRLMFKAKVQITMRKMRNSVCNCIN